MAFTGSAPWDVFSLKAAICREYGWTLKEYDDQDDLDLAALEGMVMAEAAARRDIA